MDLDRLPRDPLPLDLGHRRVRKPICNGRDANERVATIPMTPGTLMLFEGRHTLHRVSPIGGARPRYVGLFGYDRKPGTCSSELLRLIRYGRAS